MRTVKLIFLICGMAAASHASAQDLASTIVANMIGNMVAQNREMKEADEQACKGGKPAEPKAVDRLKTSTQKTLNNYYKLTSKSSSLAIRSIFVTQYTEAIWRDANGRVSIWALGDRLDEAVPTLTPKSFVAGGDGASARGIWEANIPAQSDPKYYGIGFMKEGGTMRIIDFIELLPDRSGKLPEPFCHYDVGQKW